MGWSQDRSESWPLSTRLCPLRWLPIQCRLFATRRLDSGCSCSLPSASSRWALSLCRAALCVARRIRARFRWPTSRRRELLVRRAKCEYERGFSADHFYMFILDSYNITLNNYWWGYLNYLLIILRRVVFPIPFRPIKQYRRPYARVKLAQLSNDLFKIQQSMKPDKIPQILINISILLVSERNIEILDTNIVGSIRIGLFLTLGLAANRLTSRGVLRRVVFQEVITRRRVASNFALFLLTFQPLFGFFQFSRVYVLKWERDVFHFNYQYIFWSVHLR